MKRKGGKGFWGWSRRLFRWFRIFIWILVLGAVVALLYLNRVGLPDFVKKRVAVALENEGLDLEFTRLRLSGYRHIVIDDMWLIMTNAPAPLIFAAKQAELKFDRAALRRFDFRLENLLVQNGTLTMDLATNGTAQPFAVENIRADLRSDSGDRWTLRTFEGEALGARWNISGSLTNLFTIAQRSSRTNAPTTDWRPALREVLTTFNKIEFGTRPQVTVTALGDLKELSQFRAAVSVRSGTARTPWGELDEVSVRSSVGPGVKPGEQMEANVNISVKRGVTTWGDLRGVTLTARTEYPLTNSVTFEGMWTLRADEVTTRWISARKLDLSLDTRQAGTNLLTLIQAGAENGKIFLGAAGRTTFQARLEHAYPIRALNKAVVDLMPVKPQVDLPETQETLLSLGQHWNGDWRLRFDDLRTKTGAAGTLSINGDVRERADKVQTDASWGFWREIASLLINWRAEAMDFRSPEAKLEKVVATGKWNAPELTVAGVDSQLYGGTFHLDAALDVVSRKVRAATKSNFDVKQIAWLLDPEVRPFLAQFDWQKPPDIWARVDLVAPPWVKPPGNWRNETFKSAVMDGAVAVGPASFRGVNCSGFSAGFHLTNFFWRLPNAVLTRTEGSLDLDYSGHSFNPEFRLAVRGSIDPWAAMPLLSKEGQFGLKFVKFPQPPQIDGVLTGHLNDLDRLHFEGSLSGSNIVVDGEPFLDFKTRAVYSNQWIYVYEPIAHRTTNEVLTASFGGIDIKNNLMYVTNGFSTTDPYRVTKIIGPIVYNAIAPYIFEKPPVVRAEGIIPLKDAHDADIRFQISGQDFKYWRFQMKDAVAGVYWHQQFLDVTNVAAKFYGGDMQWEGHFTFRQDDSADYRFKGVCTNADLALLLRDLLPQATNRIEGTLNGTLVITEAHSDSLQSWKGHGDGTVRDGFLWSMPIFGIFSGPLDTIVPGLGKSKIHRGEGTFRVEGGKVYTDDMEVRAPAFRLKYKGSVDFDGNLDAKVEAELFRNTWVFGRMISAAFWPLTKVLESKVTGNLGAPKSEFAHIPKVMLFPLRPIQTIKELSKDKEKETAPAAPAATPQPAPK
jgi:hypothetical protein